VTTPLSIDIFGGSLTTFYSYDQSLPILSEAPAFLRETGYENPSDPKNGMLQRAFRTNLALFPWFSRPENKERWDNANTFFEGDRGNRLSWVTWFPVQEKLLTGEIDKKAPLLVDVAGGRGHDLLEFLERFPSESGPFILQDQQPVLDSATSLPDKIQKRGIDFWKETPVKG
jgi:hypothetical protein